MLEREPWLGIERPRAHCSECNAPLEDLERHPTRLILLAEAPLRRDTCPDCWDLVRSEAYHSYWVTRRLKPEPPTPRLSRREKALAVRALFESLWDQREREDLDDHLYVLAHLLLRWGGLKWRGRGRDERGRPTVVFENPATGDPLALPAVEPPEAIVEAIKARIESFLREHAPEAEIALE